MPERVPSSRPRSGEVTRSLLDCVGWGAAVNCSNRRSVVAFKSIAVCASLRFYLPIDMMLLRLVSVAAWVRTDGDMIEGVQR